MGTFLEAGKEGYNIFFNVFTKKMRQSITFQTTVGQYLRFVKATVSVKEITVYAHFVFNVLQITW